MFHCRIFVLCVACLLSAVMSPAVMSPAAHVLMADEAKTSGSIDHSIHLRGNLRNSLHAFSHNKIGHVAFLGGSITEMDGYRPRVEAWLTQRFPDTKFTFTNAGIASTCSHTGAFRLQRDVLSRGSVDLLLVEFAVNDDQDARHSADDCIRGMEGIVRQVREHNSRADIVMIDFVNPEMLATAQSGKMQLSVEQHEKVAQRYDISSINLPAALSDRIAAGTMTWDSFGGTHPGPIGNQLAADLVSEVLVAGWKSEPSPGKPLTLAPEPHPALPSPLLASSFDRTGFLSAEAVHAGDGWQHGVPDWKSIDGSKRDRFLAEPLFHTTQPGSLLTFDFTGHAVGAYVLAGPDAGQLEVQIDNGEWQTIELYHAFSGGLHYPRTVMFATGLPTGEHTVKVRLAKTHHANSHGTAARVLAFAAAE